MSNYLPHSVFPSLVLLLLAHEGEAVDWEFGSEVDIEFCGLGTTGLVEPSWRGKCYCPDGNDYYCDDDIADEATDNCEGTPGGHATTNKEGDAHYCSFFCNCATKSCCAGCGLHLENGVTVGTTDPDTAITFSVCAKTGASDAAPARFSSIPQFCGLGFSGLVEPSFESNGKCFCPNNNEYYCANQFTKHVSGECRQNGQVGAMTSQAADESYCSYYCHCETTSCCASCGLKIEDGVVVGELNETDPRANLDFPVCGEVGEEPERLELAWCLDCWEQKINACDLPYEHVIALEGLAKLRSVKILSDWSEKRPKEIEIEVASSIVAAVTWGDAKANDCGVDCNSPCATGMHSCMKIPVHTSPTDTFTFRVKTSLNGCNEPNGFAYINDIVPYGFNTKWEATTTTTTTTTSTITTTTTVEAFFCGLGKTGLVEPSQTQSSNGTCNCPGKPEYDCGGNFKRVLSYGCGGTANGDHQTYCSYFCVCETSTCCAGCGLKLKKGATAGQTFPETEVDFPVCGTIGDGYLTFTTTTPGNGPEFCGLGETGMVEPSRDGECHCLNHVDFSCKDASAEATKSCQGLEPWYQQVQGSYITSEMRAMAQGATTSKTGRDEQCPFFCNCEAKSCCASCGLKLQGGMTVGQTDPGGPADVFPVCSTAAVSPTDELGPQGAASMSLTPGSQAGIMTWNMACRSGHFRKCDNCQVRFEQLYKAILGNGEGFVGMPDWDNLDVILAQELFLEEGDPLLALLDDALSVKGFRRVLGPAPVDTDPYCGHPFWKKSTMKHVMHITRTHVPNGGLVTWTRLKVIATHARQWCNNYFPTNHGYTIAHLQKNGTNILAFNAHFAPGDSNQIRAYQMSEMFNEGRNLADAFKLQGLPYVLLFGGETNEDLYGLENTEGSLDCSKVSDNPLIVQFLGALGLENLEVLCNNGVFGSGPKRFTWDYDHNKFSREYYKDNKVLLDYGFTDYVTVMASSDDTHPRRKPRQSPMEVHFFKKVNGYEAWLCSDAEKGRGHISRATAHPLSDHFPVSAQVRIPEGTSVANDDFYAGNAFMEATSKFTPGAASCGQDGARCFQEEHCCSKDFSYDGDEKACFHSGWHNLLHAECFSCRKKDEACNYDWECCGHLLSKEDGGLTCRLIPSGDGKTCYHKLGGEVSDGIMASVAAGAGVIFAGALTVIGVAHFACASCIVRRRNRRASVGEFERVATDVLQDNILAVSGADCRNVIDDPHSTAE